MKEYKNYPVIITAIILCFVLLSSCGPENNPTDTNEDPVQGDTTMIVDHNCCVLSQIPQQAVEDAKSSLIIAYGHTSHGSQLITGMLGLIDFAGPLYTFNGDGSSGALELRDGPFGVPDLGNPDRISWEGATRTYLDSHQDVNVVIWSWCGQVSDAGEEDIDLYLGLMNGLENDYPDVSFVYMTGHLDGGAPDCNLLVRNQQIRDYCLEYDKILYDFADIESYDPDGSYYADKRATDNCDYDSDGDGYNDRNWASEWQDANPGEWYDCDPAHTMPLNGNLKAYAAWHLWARLVGWDGS